jgi:RNA polymerase sigma-70 factor (ECF subfamily)
MASPEITPAELEATLAGLHAESFGWALSCCGWDRADAEDVLQTTYLRVVSGRARFAGRSAFRTWLFGVIRHVAREHHRRARMQLAGAERLALEAAGADEAGAASDDPVERDEVRRRLLEALAELPPRQREVLHLVFYHDLTIAEAAEVMEVSLGSARVHYERGKSRLRSLLSARDIGARAL